MAGWTVVPNGDTSAWKPVQTPPRQYTADEVTGGPFMDQVEQEAFGPRYAPPNESTLQHLGRAFSNFGGAAAGAIPEMLIHPVKTIQSVAHIAQAAQGDPTGMVRDFIPLVHAFQEHPEEATESLAGNIVGSAAAAPALEGAAGMAGDTLSGIRDTAIGDPDAAALRGLRVGPASPKSLRTISAVQGARPYLQGARSLEDVQARIPAAKSEIWAPYKQTIDTIADKPAQGPDGPTTVGQLEEERTQLSALNRGLKQQNPEALQLAQQKGMTQAQLLEREKAVQSALDPHLEGAGVDPKLIRKTFGQVAEVGGRVSGKSTLAEAKQPYGLSRLKDVSLTRPLSNVPLAGNIVKDVAAGRYFSAKPTDVALREAFRPMAEKPDFRAPYTSIPRFEFPPKQLEANVPGNSPFGEEPYPGSMNGMPTAPTHVTPPPTPSRAFLPTETTPGNSEPMLRYARPYIEPEPQGIRTPVPPQRLALPAETAPSQVRPYVAHRPATPSGEATRVVPTRLQRIQMQNQNPSGGVRGLLAAPHVPTPEPEPTVAPVFPGGSSFRDVQETPVYPPASAFRAKMPKGFDFEGHIDKLAKELKKKEQ
jgi:hypothetical protein